MINFLFGDEGCGKSTYIIEQIKNDTQNGIHSFLIVPEQQTVISEKEIATLLPPSAQLYCEAINFTRLANKIFREYGGLKYNYISKSGKSLAMYQAICECRELLKEYKILKGHEKSCVKLFLSAISELKAYGVDLKELEVASSNVDDIRLKNRLDDILLIWTSFEKLISDKYSDSADDISLLEKKLSEHNYFKGKNVYIDSFYSFTGAQLNVISQIIRQADNVTIAFDCPLNCESGAMQYAKITDARDRLFSICRSAKQKYNSIGFDTDYKHKNESIKLLGQRLWDFSAPPIENPTGITLIKSGDEFEECEYVASKIKELIFDGCKYSDIGIILRKSSTYKGIIDYSLDKYKIPYFYSTTTDIMSMPVIKMIFSALNAISMYRYEDIISYIKCGYTDISENDLNDFESYMFRWNIYGKKFKNEDYWASNPDGYVQAPTIIQMETLARVNAVREGVCKRLSILEDCFEKKCTVANASDAVFRFLNEHNIKKQLQKEIEASSRQDAYEISQVWNLLISALDTLVNICGDAYTSVDDYITLLKYALGENGIGAIPSGEDNVVIGDAPTIRAKSLKHVFVLGVNEGVFPADTTDDGFFTDIDKIALETVGIDLSSKSDIRADDELLAFRKSISLPSESLYISSLKSNIKGADMQPSIAFSRAIELLGKDAIIDTSSIPSINKIYTEENALEQVGSFDNNVRIAIKEYFNIKNDTLGGFKNDGLSIEKDTAKEIFGSHISISKSSMETFASCRLKYYCNYILKLRESSRITFAANDIGTLNHLIIEEFFNLQKNECFDASSLTDVDIEKIIDNIINEYTTVVCGSKNASSKLRYMFNKLKKSLVIYLKELVLELGQSKFSPEYMELPLTGDGKSAPRSLKFKIGENATASLSGTADRVDVYRKDGVTYVKIIDYKSGEEKISREFISKGFGLQLFIYLFTLCQMEDCDFKEKLLDGTAEIKPAGIMYFPMNISKKDINYDVDLESSEVDLIEKSTISERIARSGFFLDNVDIIQAQDKDLSGKFVPSKEKHSDWFLSNQEFNDIYEELKETINNIGNEILSGDASATPVKVKRHPCDYCSYASICRRES